MSYNEEYFIDLINEAHKSMIRRLIKVGSKIQYRVLKDSEYFDNREMIEESIEHLRETNPSRYKSAKRFALEGDYKNMADHYLAIDDVLAIDETKMWVGIDWTLNTNSSSLLQKIEKHKSLKRCHHLMGLDKSVVVLVLNVDSIQKGSETKFLYKALKLIAKEVCKKNFLGGMTIDAKDLV